MPTRVGRSREPGCALECAQDCALPRGARTAPRGRGLLSRCTGGWCPSGKCPCPKIASPQMKSVTLTHKEIRVCDPAQRKALLSPWSQPLERKGSKTPKRRKEPQNPPTSSRATAGSPTGRVERETEGRKKPSPKCVLNRSGGEGGKLRWLPAGLSSSAQPGQQFS